LIGDGKLKQKKSRNNKEFNYMIHVEMDYDIQADNEWNAIQNLCEIIKTEAHRILELKEHPKNCWSAQIKKIK